MEALRNESRLVGAVRFFSDSTRITWLPGASSNGGTFPRGCEGIDGVKLVLELEPPPLWPSLKVAGGNNGIALHFVFALVITHPVGTDSLEKRDEDV
jgi:hypothetical protein